MPVSLQPLPIISYGNSVSMHNVGGLVGSLTDGAEISDSYVGPVAVYGQENTGGLVGYAAGAGRSGCYF